MIRKNNHIFLGFLFFLASLSLAQSPSSSQINPLPDGVSIHLLDNGMQVLLIENPALPMVGANVVVKTGSAYETFATSGMSHMLEHLLFNGTTSRTQKELYNDADRIGAYNNANTADYYTNYMMVTPAGHILEGMEIQADMLFNSILPEEKFEKEKGIVLEEISKSLAGPREQLERNTNAILYPGHALSLPTLGTYATIESMSRNAVNTFFKENYVPNNMILSVIGNFKSAGMLKSIKKIYGQAKPGLIARNENPAWKTGFQKRVPKNDGRDNLYYRFYDGNDTQFQLLFPLPDISSPDYYHLMEVVLEKNMDTLENIVQEKFSGSFKRLDYFTHSSPVANYLEIRVALKQDADFDALKSTISDYLSKLTFSIAPEEIEMEVASARTAFFKNIEKPHMFGIFNAHPFSVQGIEGVLASYSGSGLNKAARLLQGLKINSQPIIIIQNPSPKPEEESSAATANQLFKNAHTGQTLIVVQNKASDLLAIHYLFKHKASLESQFGKDAAKILHDCFGQRLKSDANKAISAKFGLSFKVNDNPWFPMDDIYLHPDFGYIRIEALADDVPAVINFLNDQMNGFKPTEEEFNNAFDKFNRKNPMMGGDNKAKNFFENSYSDAIYQKPPFTKNDSTVSYKTLFDFANAYFHAGNAIVSVVSPENPKTIESLFANLVGQPIRDEMPAYSKRLQNKEDPVTIEKTFDSERAYLFWGFIKTVAENDKAALTALSLVLSDKIVFDIREKQGMAYRIRAGIVINDDKALFRINQGTRPQNVDVLVPQYPGFFTIKTLEGLSEDDVQKSLNMYLGRMMFRRLSSINQAYYLATSLYFHGDINYDATFLEQLKNIKRDDVLSVAKKYMKVEKPIQVIVR